jgi:hypothetical protein
VGETPDYALALMDDLRQRSRTADAHQDEDRLMIDVEDLFTSDRPRPETRRKEAVRLRALAREATTALVKKHLEDRAREHEALAGNPEFMRRTEDLN